jgi:hypothetical protein
MKAFMLPGLALAALLTGCDGPATPPPMFCPQVAVLQQARDLTRLSPDIAGPAGLITSARITGVAGACTLHPKKHELVVKFQTGFAATNGPANGGAPVSLPYFIAIVQGDDIIAEQDYSVTLKFDGNATAAETVAKPASLAFPNNHSAERLQVLVGFKLTPAEQAYADDHPDMLP